MRAVLLIVALLPSVAAGTVFSFAPPAQVGGNVVVEADWALLLIAPSDRAEVLLDNGESASFQQHTVIKTSGADPSNTLHPDLSDDGPSSGTQEVGPFEAGLVLGGGQWSSILVEGNLQLRLQRTNLTILSATVGTYVDEEPLPGAKGVPTAVYRETARRSTQPETTAAFYSLDGNVWSLDARGPMRIEWHNATVDCQAGSCPNVDPNQVTPTLAGQSLAASVHHFGDLRASSATMSGMGALSFGWLGATSLDVTFDGIARLPNARAYDCPNCTGGNGETWQVSGSNISLGGMQPSEDGRLLGEFSGHVHELRLDEAPVDATTLLGWQTAATVVATGVAAVGLAKLVLGLATRLATPVALAHPRRRLIYDFISANAACSFGTLQRGTGLASGPLHHHLEVMQRARIIVSNRQGQGTYFALASAAPKRWDQAAVAANPALAEVLALISSRPGITQAELANALDVRRATLQYRLAQLLQAGLVQRQSRGRALGYHASLVDSAMPQGSEEGSQASPI